MSRASIAFPRFDGRLLEDERSLTAAASNFGRHASQMPLAVLEPGSVDDVGALIRFARRRGISVAARGQGHATFTQALAEGGVIIDMRPLGRVRELSRESALVDAGARWSSVLDHVIPVGLTPPTLTDYQGLSVAGTLSVGGVGGETHRHGAQVDNVLELDVVTGEGELVRCSPEHEVDLFDACRAGLGQFGIITAARVRLVPAPPRVRMLVLEYRSLEAFVADLTRLASEDRCDHLYGNINPVDGGCWNYELVATVYLDGGSTDRAVLRGALPHSADTVADREMAYAEFTSRVEDYVAMMKRTGTWNLPHPWLDVFLPGSRAAAIIAGELEQLKPDALGSGGILVYPLRRSRCAAPFFRLPGEESVILFDVLRNAAPPDPAHVESLLESNRRSYTHSVALGATLYPIGSTPMQPGDWRKHFGEGWERFASAKRRFDPDGILTPGQGIFARL